MRLNDGDEELRALERAWAAEASPETAVALAEAYARAGDKYGCDSTLWDAWRTFCRDPGAERIVLAMADAFVSGATHRAHDDLFPLIPATGAGCQTFLRTSPKLRAAAASLYGDVADFARGWIASRVGSVVPRALVSRAPGAVRVDHGFDTGRPLSWLIENGGLVREKGLQFEFRAVIRLRRTARGERLSDDDRELRDLLGRHGAHDAVRRIHLGLPAAVRERFGIEMPWSGEFLGDWSLIRDPDDVAVPRVILGARYLAPSDRKFVAELLRRVREAAP